MHSPCSYKKRTIENVTEVHLPLRRCLPIIFSWKFNKKWFVFAVFKHFHIARVAMTFVLGAADIAAVCRPANAKIKSAPYRCLKSKQIPQKIYSMARRSIARGNQQQYRNIIYINCLVTFILARPRPRHAPLAPTDHRQTNLWLWLHSQCDFR